MSQLTSVTRAMLILVPALWWFAGCKPVADTQNTPLPTQGTDPSADESADSVPTVTVPGEPATTDTEPTTTQPATTPPVEDQTGAEPAATDSTASQPADTSADGQDTPADGQGSNAEPAQDTSNETDSSAETNAAGDLDATDLPTDEQAATTTSLTIGSVAPPLQIGQWIKGEAVDDFKPGRVYVVEFWATWCGPCRTSMPHISQLQTELKDSATFIGVTQENEETVRSFMAKVQNAESGKTWDEVVQYAIALDSGGATSNAYMRAAGQNGIPTAFVVGKDGHIEWIGHPMSIEQPLAQIIGDQWDRAAALAKFEDDRAAERAYQEVSTAARRAKQTGDWTEATQMVEKMVLKHPDSEAFKILQFNLLLMAEQYQEVNQLADELSQKVWDSADSLNRIAWQMVTSVPEDQRNLELALKIALRAGELADHNASVLDTVARVYFEMGDRDAAIQWQQRAVDAAPDNTGLSDTLKKYQAEKQQDQ